MRSFLIISALFIGLAVAGATFLFQMPSVLAASADLGLNELQATGTGLATDSPGAYAATIIRWVLGIIGVLLVALLVYGGVLYATSAGNEKQVETGKQVLTYAIIGIVIVFSALLVSQFVVSALQGDDAATSVDDRRSTGSVGLDEARSRADAITSDISVPTSTKGNCVVTDNDQTCCKSSSGKYDLCYDKKARNTDKCHVDSKGELCCPNIFGIVRCSK